jgi:hypothetical protein
VLTLLPMPKAGPGVFCRAAPERARVRGHVGIPTRLGCRRHVPAGVADRDLPRLTSDFTEELPRWGEEEHVFVACASQLAYRSRNAGYPAPPAQIRT